MEEFVRFFDIGEFLGGFIFVVYFEIKKIFRKCERSVIMK